jgi:protein SCO1
MKSRAQRLAALAAAGALLACCWTAFAQAGSTIDQNDAPSFDQRLGAALPSTLRLFDSTGTPVDWKAISDQRRPIVLLPAYYRCDTLCGTVAHGALEALADTGLSRDDWTLLLFSIDPSDTPGDARALRTVYEQYARWARPQVFAQPARIELLTGDERSTRDIAQIVGWRWLAQSSAASERIAYAHATGIVVLTPDRVVSRYLFGVRFDPAQLRLAIVEASDGRVGTVTDQLLLACAHLDPLLGGRDGLVLGVLRGMAAALIAELSLWIWRHRAGPGKSKWVSPK